MTEREKMIAGLPYDPGDPELRDGRARAVGLTMRINQEPDRDARRALVNDLIRSADGEAVEPEHAEELPMAQRYFLF